MSQRSRLQWHRWEGAYTVDFTLEHFHQRVGGFARVLAGRKWSCVVAHDTRFLGHQFARYAYQVLASQGVRVSLCPTPAPIPTVELAIEQKRADCALVVSACNHPHWYNGLLAFAPTDEPLLEQAVPSDQQQTLLTFPPVLEAEPTQINLRAPYFEMLRDTVDVDLIRRSAMTVFADPMHGCTSGCVPELIGEGAQTKAIEINRETDPLFGRQAPNPVESGLQRLRKLVKESDSHLGVGLSADGRAIGVTDNSGDLVPPQEVALLVAQYLARQHRLRGTVVIPQAEGQPPRNWEQVLGLKVEVVADPATRMQELLTHDRNSLLAGATAIGEVTLGRYHAAPDALLVAAMLIELTARSGGKLRALVDELRGKLAG